MNALALRKTHNLVSIFRFAAKQTLETVERIRHPSHKRKPEARRGEWGGDLPRTSQQRPRTRVCAQLCRVHRCPSIGFRARMPKRRG